MSFMDVVGNNIANVNTIAFKSSRVNFQDILGQTLKGANSAQNGRGGTNPAQIGLGMTMGGIDTLMSQGSLQTTGKLTDFAIQGDGFFAVSDGTRNYFTRDGGFDIGIDGGLVNPNTGLRVMGWAANSSGVVDTQAPLTKIDIPFGTRVNAQSSSKMDFAGNLDASAAIGTSVATTVTAYDSLGISNSVRVAMTKVAANAWAVTNNASSITGAAFGATPLGAGSSITGSPNDLRPGTWDIALTGTGAITAQFTPALFTPPNTFAAGAAPEPLITGTIPAGGVNTTLVPGLTITAPTVLGVATTQFTTGLGAAPATATAISFTTGGQFVSTNPAVSISLTPTNGATSPQAITLNVSSFSQFAGQSQVSLTNQDGFPAGALVSFAVGSSGEISGIYSNGANRVIGQLAMAGFVNPGGLMRAGQNLWTSSANSGDPLLGTPNTGGRGTVTTGTLETSNVDLAQQFTNVIIAQRGFQSSSRVITASDQMLQDLVNIIR
jgi:flagellar hook protein FlgE